MDSTVLIIFKPDCVRRGLTGKVIQRFVDRDVQILSLRMFDTGSADKFLRETYSEHKDKPWFENQIKFMNSGPIIVAVMSCDSKSGRDLVGNRSTPGTIRGDYATGIRENVIHCSDSQTAAAFEINIWKDIL